MMHQLLKGSDSAVTSPFPWMADEVAILEAAGFHDIKVSTLHACIATQAHHAVSDKT